MVIFSFVEGARHSSTIIAFLALSAADAHRLAAHITAISPSSFRPYRLLLHAEIMLCRRAVNRRCPRSRRHILFVESRQQASCRSSDAAREVDDSAYSRRFLPFSIPAACTAFAADARESPLIIARRAHADAELNDVAPILLLSLPSTDDTRYMLMLTMP